MVEKLEGRLIGIKQRSVILPDQKRENVLGTPGKGGKFYNTVLIIRAKSGEQIDAQVRLEGMDAREETRHIMEMTNYLTDNPVVLLSGYQPFPINTYTKIEEVTRSPHWEFEGNSLLHKRPCREVLLNPGGPIQANQE